MEDFERARQAFEDDLEMWIAAGVFGSPPATATGTKNEKPLTASAKKLKELELQFLEYLKDSDDTIDPLVELWMSEREDAALELWNMMDHCSPGLHHEERALRAMIDQYGDDWVEPMSRLAVLLFTKHEVAEAEDWCWKVLRAKPWHFEMAQLLVVLLLRKGELPKAIRVAREFSLPSLNDRTNHKRRRAWVQRRMAQAQDMLQRAELATAALVHDDPFDECPLGQEDKCWQ